MAAEIPSVKPDILIIVSKLFLFIDSSSAVTVVCPFDQSQVTFQPNTVVIKLKKRKHLMEKNQMNQIRNEVHQNQQPCVDSGGQSTAFLDDFHLLFILNGCEETLLIARWRPLLFFPGIHLRDPHP